MPHIQLERAKAARCVRSGVFGAAGGGLRRCGEVVPVRRPDRASRRARPFNAVLGSRHRVHRHLGRWCRGRTGCALAQAAHQERSRSHQPRRAAPWSPITVSPRRHCPIADAAPPGAIPGVGEPQRDGTGVAVPGEPVALGQPDRDRTDPTTNPIPGAPSDPITRYCLVVRWVMIRRVGLPRRAAAQASVQLMERG